METLVPRNIVSIYRGSVRRTCAVSWCMEEAALARVCRTLQINPIYCFRNHMHACDWSMYTHTYIYCHCKHNTLYKNGDCWQLLLFRIQFSVHGLVAKLSLTGTRAFHRSASIYQLKINDPIGACPFFLISRWGLNLENCIHIQTRLR